MIWGACGVTQASQETISTSDHQVADEPAECTSSGLNEFLESIVPMGARRRGQLLEQIMSEYNAGQNQNNQAPTFVLHACDDTLVSFEQGEFPDRNIPGAQLIPILAISSAIAFLLAAAALLRWVVPGQWFQWLIVAGAVLSIVLTKIQALNLVLISVSRLPVKE